MTEPHPHFASIVFDEREVQVMTCAVMEHALPLLEDPRDLLNECAKAENAVRLQFTDRERLEALGSALDKLRLALGARAGILTEG